MLQKFLIMNFSRSTLQFFVIIGCIASLLSCNEGFQESNAPIQEVPFTQVHLDDSFWAPRIETNRTVSIPSAFKQCEINGRFDNFAIAGGLMKGEHKGDFPFDDTDPYKIIEGASYSLAAHYDADLDQYLDSVITLIAAAQEEDGYLTTCVTNNCTRLSGWWGTHRWEKINSHELYNSGHLYEAAVAHFKATGKRSLLDVAIKNADLVCEVFGDGENQIHRPGGHPIVEMALCKLYKVTGDEKYLQQAKYFVDETGRCTDGHKPSMYSQDHMPILQQEEIVGHAVRAGYLFSGVADVASLTNDTAYQRAIERIWENMAEKKLYITGGIGSRAQGEGFGPEYELHNHTAYCETCAAISNVYWNYRMFLATGDSKYYDVLERALYNGVISGVSLSGDRFFYDNPLESMGQHERAKWFGCACCPGNITRFMASVPLYMYALRNDGVHTPEIFVNLFIQSESTIELGDNKIKIKQVTDYPWDGKIKLVVSPEIETKFALRLRIPGEGYKTIVKTWKTGDEVELELPMDVRQVSADPQVVDDRGKLAVLRGPIVYCLEGKDQKDGIVFNKVIEKDAKFETQYDKDLLCGVVTLKTKAQEVQKDSSLLEVDALLIPYSTWCNRGVDQMEVWIPAAKEFVHITPEETIASKATASEFGMNDQWEPTSSSDTSKPYQYWWLKKGTLESATYHFDQAYTVSQVSVYWLDFDHYDGDFRTPESWKLYYLDGQNRWKEVSALNTFGVEKDQYNVVKFSPIKTTGLKIEAQLKSGVSGGIIEWKVN